MTPAPRRRRGVSAKFRRPAASTASDSVGDQGAETGNELGAGERLQPDPVQAAQDWHGIGPGLSVEVHLPGGFSFQGTVDAKTEDSGVVWIKSDTGFRQMFGHLEGVRLSPLGPANPGRTRAQ